MKEVSPNQSSIIALPLACERTLPCDLWKNRRSIPLEVQTSILDRHKAKVEN
jgi:hypothetical protein